MAEIQIATKEYVDTTMAALVEEVTNLATAQTGYTILYQKTYRVKNIVFTTIIFKKTDNTALPSTGHFVPVIVSLKASDNINSLSFSGKSSGGSPKGYGACHVSYSGGVNTVNREDGVAQGAISGCYIIG